MNVTGKFFRAGKTLLKRQRGLLIGQLIALIRKQLQMSQQALAQRAKIKQSTISRIEVGSFQPQIPTLKKPCIP